MRPDRIFPEVIANTKESGVGHEECACGFSSPPAFAAGQLYSAVRTFLARHIDVLACSVSRSKARNSSRGGSCKFFPGISLLKA